MLPQDVGSMVPAMRPATMAITSWDCRCARRGKVFERDYLIAQISRFSSKSLASGFVGMGASHCIAS